LIIPVELGRSQWLGLPIQTTGDAHLAYDQILNFGGNPIGLTSHRIFGNK
jgi:hypothetical protein